MGLVCRLSAVFGILVLIMPSAAADKAALTRAIIEQGLRAQGGKEARVKLMNAYVKMKGAVIKGNDSFPVRGETWTRQPDQMKSSWEIEVARARTVEVLVLNGKKGWAKKNDRVADADEWFLRKMRDDVYRTRVTALYPLLDDPTFVLAQLGETTVNGRKAVGVKVSSKGYKDICIYFDKDTHLVAKSVYYAVNVNEKKDYLVEQFPSKFEKVMGSILPMRVVTMVDGKKFGEVEIEVIRPLRDVEASIFGKP